MSSWHSTLRSQVIQRRAVKACWPVSKVISGNSLSETSFILRLFTLLFSSLVAGSHRFRSIFMTFGHTSHHHFSSLLESCPEDRLWLHPQGVRHVRPLCLVENFWPAWPGHGVPVDLHRVKTKHSGATKFDAPSVSFRHKSLPASQ